MPLVVIRYFSFPSRLFFFFFSSTFTVKIHLWFTFHASFKTKTKTQSCRKLCYVILVFVLLIVKLVKTLVIWKRSEKNTIEKLMWIERAWKGERKRRADSRRYWQHIHGHDWQVCTSWLYLITISFVRFPISL